MPAKGRVGTVHGLPCGRRPRAPCSDAEETRGLLTLPRANRRASRPALVLLQVLVFVTYLLGPTSALGEEPSPDPSAPTPSAPESPAPEPPSDPSTPPAPEPTAGHRPNPLPTCPPSRRQHHPRQRLSPRKARPSLRRPRSPSRQIRLRRLLRRTLAHGPTRHLRRGHRRSAPARDLRAPASPTRAPSRSSACGASCSTTPKRPMSSRLCAQPPRWLASTSTAPAPSRPLPLTPHTRTNGPCPALAGISCRQRRHRRLVDRRDPGHRRRRLASRPRRRRPARIQRPRRLERLDRCERARHLDGRHRGRRDR